MNNPFVTGDSRDGIIFRHEPEAYRMRAAALWRGVVGTGIILALLGIVHAAWILTSIEQARSGDAALVTPTAPSRRSYDATLRALSERRDRYAERAASAADIPLPSRGK